MHAVRPHISGIATIENGKKRRLAKFFPIDFSSQGLYIFCAFFNARRAKLHLEASPTAIIERYDNIDFQLIEIVILVDAAMKGLRVNATVPHSQRLKESALSVKILHQFIGGCP